MHTRDFILFDFQTTGTAASKSDIIEAGWGLYCLAADAQPEDWQCFLVRRPGEIDLPRSIARLTGIPQDYAKDPASIDLSELQAKLRHFLFVEHPDRLILVHYAQFKLPFLTKALGDVDAQALSERVICLHKLARVYLPALKSHSLRSLAAYAGYSAEESKRSREHLTATAAIWRCLGQHAGSYDQNDDQLKPWLLSRAAIPSELAIASETLRKKRLGLPQQPGVYFFKDQTGRILYVGKAANLKHRVNSYFRGRKSKGSRLNEMLIRAFDFDFVTVGSELEALLRENEEIKRIDPPYNRALRTGDRQLQSLQLSTRMGGESPAWAGRIWGGITTLWNLEALLPLALQKDELVVPLLLQALPGLDPTLMTEARARLFERYGQGEAFDDPSAWLAIGRQSLAAYEATRAAAALLEDLEVEEEEDEEVEEPSPEAKTLTAEDLEDFLASTLRQLLRQFERQRWLLRLTDVSIDWLFVQEPSRWHHLAIEAGEIRMEAGADPSAPSAYQRSFLERGALLNPLMHDRLSIVYTELRKGLARGDEIRMHLRPGLVLSGESLRKSLGVREISTEPLRPDEAVCPA